MQQEQVSFAHTKTHKAILDAFKRKPHERPLMTFLHQVLGNSEFENYITWKDFPNGIFRILDPPGLAKLWGESKGLHNMTYEKMSRSLRHYYKINMLRKATIKGLRHCYQFTNWNVKYEGADLPERV